MAKPVSFQFNFGKGMRRDEPRQRMQPASCWNLVDFVPDLGAPLGKRGGWTYASPSITASSTTYIKQTKLAPFTGGSQLLGWSDSGHLFKITSTTSATDVGASPVPLHEPVIHADKVVITASDGTTTISTYDGTTLTSVSSQPPGKYAVVYKDRTWLAGTSANPNRIYGSAVHNPASYDMTLSYVSVSQPITGLAALPNSMLVFQSGVTSRVRGAIPPPGTDMVVDDPLFTQGCTDARSIVVSGPYAIFANQLGVWRTIGTSVPEELTAIVGMRRYWRTLLSSYSSSSWTLAAGMLGDKYVISIMNGSTFVDCLVFEGAAGTTVPRCYRLSNVKAAGMATSPATGEVYVGSRAAGRVYTMSSTMDISAPTKTDADGTSILPIWESPYVFDDGLDKYVRTVMAGYDLRDAASDNPYMTLSYIKKPDDSYAAVSETLAETTDYQNSTRVYLTGTAGAGLRTPGLGLKLVQTNASAFTRIMMMRLEAQAMEASRTYA